MIAISPQLAEINRELIEKHRLNFEILHDRGNAYADELDLVHGFPEELREIYRGFGAALPDFNGEPSWTLPLSTRIVVDRFHTIQSIQFHADYKQRPEPEATLAVVQRIAE